MLPILRVIPVGGVLLAITILVLALNPPDGPRTHPTPAMAPASGALIARGLHPEWRQFLMLAALRRASELKRLLELPDTPLRSAPPQTPPKAEPAPAIAAIPNSRSDADPEDVTGSIVQTPDAAIPVDIGETSSTELPVIPRKERPPVVTPGRAKRQRDGSAAPEPANPLPKRTAHRARQAKPVARQEATAQFNFFEALFGGRDVNPSAATPRQPSSAAPRSFGAAQ
jgi:hypothetical protein